MTEILKYWRDLGKETRKELMQKHSIKKITYEQIKIIYNENIVQSEKI